MRGWVGFPLIMAMTLNDLREQMKASLPAARLVYKHNFEHDINMREFWVKVRNHIKLHENFPSMPKPAPAVYKFYEAGRIYYHAKKYGLRSAMMLKLSTQ